VEKIVFRRLLLIISLLLIFVGIVFSVIFNTDVKNIGGYYSSEIDGKYYVENQYNEIIELTKEIYFRNKSYAIISIFTVALGFVMLGLRILMGVWSQLLKNMKFK